MFMRDAEDHKVLQEAGKAWRRIKDREKRIWQDWTTKIGPGLLKARVEAMHRAGTNRPMGRGYNEAMSNLLVAYHLDDMEGVARNDMLSIMEHLSEVEEWRADQDYPDRLNHPTTVWRGFKKSARWRDIQIAAGTIPAYDEEDAKEGRRSDKKSKAFDELEAKSRIAELTRKLDQVWAQLEEAQAEIERLKEELAETRQRLRAAGLDTGESLDDEHSDDVDDGLPKGSQP